MEKKKKIINIVTTVFLVLLLLYLTIGILPYEFNVYSYEVYAKVLTYLIYPVFIIFILQKILSKESTKFIEVIVILIGFFLILSYNNAIDKNMALYGVLGRHEGLYEIILYYGIFLISKFLPQKNQKIILYSILGIGVFQILLGHIQFIHIPTFMGIDMTSHYSYKYIAASGTLGNPNFYATYMLICSSYLFIIIFKDNEKINKKKILKILLLLLFSYGLLISNTSTCIIIYILLIISSFIIRFIHKRQYKTFIVLLFVVLVLTLFTFNVKTPITNRISKQITNNVSEINQLFKEGINEKSFNGRIDIWNRALNDNLSHRLTGIGIDNFIYLNDGNKLCNDKECFDKAHNELIQIYVCEGIFTLILYVFFITYVYIYGFKKLKVNNNYYFAIYISVIMYFIQSLLNIRVIEVAPMYFMLLGFLFNDDKEIELIEEKN